MGKEKREGPSVGPDEIGISIEPEIEKGAYCNLASIHHSQAEFVLDFIFVMGNSGNVASRVITNPQHAKALLAALGENVGKYEARYGEIIPAQQPSATPIIAH